MSMVNTLGIQGNVASIELYMSQIVRAVERGNTGTVKPIVKSVLEHCTGIRSLLNESAYHVELVADLSKTVEPPADVPAVEVPAWIAERWRTMESPPISDEDGSKVGDDPKVGSESEQKGETKNVGETTQTAG